MFEQVPPCVASTPAFVDVWQDGHALQQRYTELQASDFPTYAGSMPALQGLDADTTMRYIDMHPEDADPSEAIVVPFPFATGFLPHMAARMEMIQAAAPNPTRLIAFPNGDKRTPTASYTKEELREIAAGDFTPYSDRVFRTLEHLGATSLHVVGYSQGAATGGHLLARMHTSFDTQASGIFEPPNIVAQPLGRLVRGFLATGADGPQRALEASQIPWLLQSMTSGNALRDTANLLRWAQGCISGVNAAIARGMARHPLDRDLFEAVRGGTQLTLARAEQSTVTPAHSFNSLVTTLTDHFPGRINALEVQNAGHEMGDDIVLHGILAAIALRKEQTA